MLKRFSDIRMKDVSICGGKGASLGEMMNAGLPIPNGFVLTTNAYGKNSKDREEQVLEAFDKLNTKFVAVRSSGTKEDGVDDSFAGQFDTYLFVTRENLIKKIKECHDSVNSERIVSYCEYKGIDISSIKVAVVVQKMVNSESAGVCFTVNPVSQNPDEIMIDAGYGVGEAVVSGMITPDNYIVNKKTGEIKKNISQQEKKLVLSDKGGTKEVEILKEEQETQKLSDKHIQELAELAKKIEKHYGKPMDTEWAIENGELFMLQARPITTLGDKIETKRYTIYPAGDFNTSFISNYSVVLGYTKFPKLLGLPICDGPHVVRNGDLEYIFDMSTRDACEKSIVQKMDDDANYIDNLIDKMMEEGKNLCERIKKKNQKSDLKKLKNEELLEILEEFVEYQSNIYAYGTSFNFIGYGEDNYITKNLNKIFKEKNIPEGKINEVMEIFTYPYKESFSQQQEIEILELLNKYINKHKKDFINDCKNRELQYIQEKYSDFFEELKSHSKKYSRLSFGFTGPAGNISDFFADVKKLVSDKLGINDRLEAIKNKRIVNEKNKKIWMKKLCPNKNEKLLLETAGKIVWAKPTRKDYQSQAYCLLESIIIEISNRLKIDTSTVRQMSISNMRKFLEGKYDSKLQTEFQKFYICVPKSPEKVEVLTGDKAHEFYDDNVLVEKNKIDVQDNVIKGNTACKGSARGIVKIINSKNDMSKMEVGNILVSVATSPSIVAAMKKAAAIITDSGGLTCHAAIVSRELGIPCVIGTKIATQVLKDGDFVEVDADNGIVKILESENNEIVKTNKFSVNEFVYLMGKGKKSDIKIVEDFLNNSDWDVQRFNASPVFVNPTGMGNNYIFQKYFGISYSGFFFNYRGHQREMGYNLKDFHRLWAKLGNSYLHPGFVEEVAKDYYEIFSYFENIFNQIDNGLVIDENNIIEMLKIVNRAQCYSVGIAHSTELINYICSYELKPILEDAIGKEKFREIESKIFVADSLSFFAVEQNELYKIAMLKKGDEQDKLLREHLKKWNWILNSYVGAKELDVEFFVNRMEKVLHDGEIKLDLKQRDELIGSLSISEEQKNIIKLINYTTSRHDNRKANILKTIGYFEKILRILSNISKISFEDLLYLSFSDIDGLNSLKDLIDMEEELKQRRKGVIYILNDLKEYIYTKDDYKKLNGILERLYAEQSAKELKGLVANKGYARGKVRICNSMEKISEFKEGEILVASMTRPEYITAIKKCIAIITDEGGITCHAAIVSRELGKPCIIGTKIATQVLKDGDLVEVDASLGEVRIVK